MRLRRQKFNALAFGVIAGVLFWAAISLFVADSHFVCTQGDVSFDSPGGDDDEARGSPKTRARRRLHRAI